MSKVSASQCESCLSKNNTWLLLACAPDRLQTYLIALYHPLWSMYPLVVVCNTQLYGIPIIRSALSVVDWWNTTGGMKHWPSTRVKKNNVHQNEVRSPVCVYHIWLVTHHVYKHTMFVHVPFGYIIISSQLQTCDKRGWISFKSGSGIMSLSILLHTFSFMMCCLTLMFVRGLYLYTTIVVTFVGQITTSVVIHVLCDASDLWTYRSITKIWWNMTHVSLGHPCFARLFDCADTLILPVKLLFF